MPSRWFMPRENVPTRLPATSLSPTMSSTSRTRRRAMPLLSASQVRWLAALRPPTMALASRSAPTERRGSASWWYGLAVHPDFARARGVQAQDHAHGGRLAGPVGAEEAGHLPGLHGE